jgi:hypothetical protein
MRKPQTNREGFFENIFSAFLLRRRVSKCSQKKHKQENQNDEPLFSQITLSAHSFAPPGLFAYGIPGPGECGAGRNDHAICVSG